MLLAQQDPTQRQPNIGQQSPDQTAGAFQPNKGFEAQRIEDLLKEQTAQGAEQHTSQLVQHCHRRGTAATPYKRGSSSCGLQAPQGVQPLGWGALACVQPGSGGDMVHLWGARSPRTREQKSQTLRQGCPEANRGCQQSARRSLHVVRLAARHQHCDVVAVEQDLVQLGDALALGRDLDFLHILQHHVYVHIKPTQRANDLLVTCCWSAAVAAANRWCVRLRGWRLLSGNKPGAGWWEGSCAHL